MIRYTVCVLAILALTACGGSGGSGFSDTTAVSSGSFNDFATPSASEMMSNTTHMSSNTSFDGMLNGVRADNGAAPVSYDARLGAAAQGHANDMLANNFFSHTGSNGSSVGDRATAAGYNWRTIGENIARGYADEAGALDGWVNSPGHQENNVNPNFEDFALARAGSGSNQYWVLVLGAEF